MKIAIASDHGGFNLKEYLIKNIKDAEIIDEGCFSLESVDYPFYAKLVANDLQEGKANLGVLICTNGIGMSIAANKFKGIRAALVFNISMAEHARSHNNANIICLGNDNVPFEDSLNFVEKFITTPFSYIERHQRRVDEIIKFEEEQ